MMQSFRTQDARRYPDKTNPTQERSVLILLTWRPNNCRVQCHNRAVGRLLLCATALGALLVGASIASGQYLEAVIRLPDTLGPLNGPYHLAWDENPVHPRLYIGGEADSGGVIVAEAITCKRLARVSTGPVRALYFVPPHGKLYVARLGVDSLVVVDCVTNQISLTIHTADSVSVMQYNSQNDRLYCGGNQISVIDCAADSMMGTIPVAASAFSYDSVSNKLYVGRSGPLAVIDCAVDSVVAAIPEVESATALCLNPTAQKVYAVTTDTLFAIRADGDSVVARLPFDSLAPLLACDPQRNRIYCTGSKRDWGYWSSIDCSSDTVLQTCATAYPLTFLACNASRDMLYVFLRTAFDEVLMYDATTGQVLTSVMVDGVPPGGGWSPALDRLYCFPLRRINGDPGYSCCLLSAIDGAGDSIVGVVPLTVKAENIVLDTVHNRLYFTYASSGSGCVGVVDCAQNVVTSYVYGGMNPYAICYNSNNDRLYWRSGGRSITVYDCSTSTKIKKVNASGDVRMMRLQLGLNKLYVFSYGSGGKPTIDVVDCDRDSLVKVIHLPADAWYVNEMLLVPEDNTLWYVGAVYVAAIDCLGDSIIAAAPDTLASSIDACACPEDRKIYAGGNEIALSVNMDKPGEMDTLHERIPGACMMRFLSIPGAHKAYWIVNRSSGSSRLFVIDTRNNTLVDSLWVSPAIAGMCLDHTGNFVYCAALYSAWLVVVDARVDSVVAIVGLPPIIAAEKNPLVLNRATNRIYVAQYDVYRFGNEIPVIRDSMLIGLEELVSSSPSRCIGPTVVGRGTPMRVPGVSELWDVTGRRVAVLKAGPNDVSRLAPGVYFMREAQAQAQAQVVGVQRSAVTVRKIVISE